MRRAVLLSLVVPLMLLAACGTADDTGEAVGSSTPPATSSDPATTTPGDVIGDLVVEYDPGEGAPVERYTLSCGGTVEGDLPDPEAACEHLRELEEPFAPVPDDAICTQQYGGPQTAHVTGVWRGEPVDLQLSRTDGCRIAQWERLGPLLPGPAG
ncbi:MULTISPECIES: SSI family serine proteinase inhibitor [unclassified Modestobacter]|uniref:SSI family serine proteinase inhibitor n=1 Tax=unclassified Modestobacter TaxID=2643866 RepID=UPI0022AA54AB|nr:MULTISPECIES: SSI family serine proteinase inhibitor [unclassified Modestobacter]MCZ2824971.1 SSI family serine proteinase inhibitor [Modestobacter sp. VKM Ac-2981]MCZ2854526.1 SSI family serine proteinase inhibitor [Modestobacter sp. VKM Ac-2982]